MYRWPWTTVPGVPVGVIVPLEHEGDQLLTAARDLVGADELRGTVVVHIQVGDEVKRRAVHLRPEIEAANRIRTADVVHHQLV